MAVKRNKRGQVEKGSVLNPAGRPKSRTLSEHYREWLLRPSEQDSSRTNADLIAETTIKAAIAGDIGAIRELCDRTEGKPKQAIDMAIDQTDWRALAAAHGLNISDVINEARDIIESYDAGSDAEGH